MYPVTTICKEPDANTRQCNFGSPPSSPKPVRTPPPMVLPRPAPRPDVLYICHRQMNHLPVPPALHTNAGVRKAANQHLDAEIVHPFRGCLIGDVDLVTGGSSTTTNPVGGAVAGKVGGPVVGTVGGAVSSDVYAVAAAVVSTTYRSLILVPEIEIPPGDDIVNAPRPNVERTPVRSRWRGFVAKLYQYTVTEGGLPLKDSRRAGGFGCRCVCLVDGVRSS